MCAKLFTQDQILCGLRIFCKEEIGISDFFDADMRIDEHLMVEGIWAELDTADLAHELSEFFGFSCSLEEWEQFFGWSANARDAEGWEQLFGFRFTFRGLAEFIRERAQPILLEPLTLLGKPCLTAGIFRGLEQLAEQLNPNVLRFAPSTPIHECLRGPRLHRFWNRLRWIVEERIPPPPRLILSMRTFMNSLVFKFGIGVLIALWKRDLEGLLAGVLLTFLLLIPVGGIMAFINSRMNPLPEGIETFGDLARYLAVIIVDQQPKCA